MGDGAFRFVDFLKSAGQSVWQILPVGITGAGESPYQSVSTFAGNPYLIDPDVLRREGLLSDAECGEAKDNSSPERVDYEKIEQTWPKLLLAAFSRFQKDSDYDRFCAENSCWLDDLSLYLAIKKEQHDLPFWEWPEPIKVRDEGALAQARTRLNTQIDFERFVQFKFFEQWGELKRYANSHGVEIVGDLPIYVCADSADVWQHPELFELTEQLTPALSAGVPPDGYSDEGQNWGSPVYRWSAHLADGCRWWIDRLAHCFNMFDRVRIDHFRGFEAFYVIKSDAHNARDGQWVKGPGIDFFRAAEKELGPLPVIAEDLGFITEPLKEMLSECGYPGMKVLEFAFGDSGAHNTYLPHNYTRNCVAYPGTHDNNTIVGWYAGVPEWQKAWCKMYLGVKQDEDVRAGMLRAVHASVADLVVVMIQDYLGLDCDARMNEPGVPVGNWRWRMDAGLLTEKLAREIAQFAEIYGRAR